MPWARWSTRSSSRRRLRGERGLPVIRENLKNFIDVLVLTQPDAIEQIHRQYLGGGADIIETNTFGATSVAMADFGMSDCVRELNLAAVALARKAADETQRTNSRQAAVRGRVDRSDEQTALDRGQRQRPGYRAVTLTRWSRLITSRWTHWSLGESTSCLAETAFDTLVLKACLFAIDKYFADHGVRLPVMASFTIFEGGRTLSAQTVEACWNSISHANLLSVGMNCALGPDKLRPYIEELSQVAPVYVSCYPNAGLPNAFGGFDETPEMMAATLGEFAAMVG